MDAVARDIGYLVLAVLATVGIFALIAAPIGLYYWIKERRAAKEAVEPYWMYKELEIFKDKEERHKLFTLVEVYEPVGPNGRPLRRKRIWLLTEANEPLERRTKKIQKQILRLWEINNGLPAGASEVEFSYLLQANKQTSRNRRR